MVRYSWLSDTANLVLRTIRCKVDTLSYIQPYTETLAHATFMRQNVWRSVQTCLSPDKLGMPVSLRVAVLHA